MGKVYLTYDEFVRDFKDNPLETLLKISQGRRFSEKQNSHSLTKSALRLLTDKLKQGDTLKEFFELISINTEESLWRLLNTWLPLKDVIDEEKGIYPLMEDKWNLYNATVAYFNIEEKPINNIIIPAIVLEKFFKVYKPANNGVFKEIKLKFNEVEYKATIKQADMGNGILDWGKEFSKLIKELYKEFYEGNNPFYYQPQVRFLWNRENSEDYDAIKILYLHAVGEKRLLKWFRLPVSNNHKENIQGLLEPNSSFKIRAASESPITVELLGENLQLNKQLIYESDDSYLANTEEVLQAIKENHSVIYLLLKSREKGLFQYLE